MRRTTRLKQLIADPAILVMPGVHDALGARLAEAAGFAAVTAGGYGATATLLGRPDSSQLSLTELSEMYSRLCDATSLPILADADTGFGNVTNVARTVALYEKAGVAGLFIEDQVFPKRCGHLDRKQVIGADAFVSKVRAAAENRPDPELVLIARTDARAVHGFEEAVERANRALEAGADVAFVEAPQTLEELAEVPRRVEGPCLLNIVAAGRTPDIGLEEAAELGYALAIVPVLLLAAVMAAGDAALAGLAATGRHPDGVPVIGVEELFRRAGSGRWDDVRARYGAD